jgi:peptide deformylase
LPLYPIVLYPEPVLLRATRLVAAITPEIRALVKDMWLTMYDAPGVGLAANQIGVDLRIAVIDTTSADEPGQKKLVLINPVVLETGGRQSESEGCLSFPGFTENVTRPEWAKIRALDIDGKEYEAEGTGLLARAFIHETDHLDGRPFIERMSVLKRDLIKRRIRKQMKAGTWETLPDQPEPLSARHQHSPPADAAD